MFTRKTRAISRRFVSFLLAFSLMCGVCGVAFAKSTYFIQTALNSYSWSIAAAVIEDDYGGWTQDKTLESARFGAVLLDDMSDNDHLVGKLKTTVTDLLGTEISSISYQGDNLALSFPGYTDGRKSALASDEDRAYAVMDALVYDFNTMLDLLYPNRAKDWAYDEANPTTSGVYKFTSSVMGLLEKINEMNSSGDPFTVNGAVVNKATSSMNIRMYDSTTHYSDYISITKDGTETFLLYRIAKGYVLTDSHVASGSVSRVSPIGLGLFEADHTKDVMFVNWDMIVSEAIVGSLLEGERAVTLDNYASGETSSFTEAIVGFFAFFLNSLKSILQLWSLDQLIFNTGSRGTVYAHGVFPSSWEGVIWGLYMVSFLLGILIVFWAITTAIAGRSLATANMHGRMNAWSRLQDIILVGILLSVLPLLIQILLSFSSNLTTMLMGGLNGSTIVSARTAASASNGGVAGSIGGVIVQFMFFGIDVYYNFFYMVRALFVGGLIVAGPIMVACHGLGGNKKSLLMTWAKEIASYVLAQPLHAVVFLLLVLVPPVNRTFDTVIMFYATIPLTKFLRTTFFGGAGGAIDAVAEKGKSGTTGALNAAGGAAVGGLASAYSGAKGGSDKSSSGASSSSLSKSLSSTKIPSNTNQQPVFSGVSKESGMAANTGISKDSASTISANSSLSSAGGISGAVSKQGGSSPLVATSSDGGSSIPIPNSVQEDGVPVSSDNTVVDYGGGTSKEKLSNMARSVGACTIGLAGVAGGVTLAAAGGMIGYLGNRDVGKAISSQGNRLSQAGGSGMRNGVTGYMSKASELKNTPSQTHVPDYQESQANSSSEVASNPLYQQGQSSYNPDTNTTSTIMNKDDLSEAGISNVDAQDSNISYTASGDSAYGEEMSHYSEMLSSMSPEERQNTIDSTGISASAVTKGGEATGDIAVSVNPQKYAEATGTDISYNKGTLKTVSGGNTPGNITPQFNATRTPMAGSSEGTPQATQNTVIVPPSQAKRITNTQASQGRAMTANGSAEYSNVVPAAPQHTAEARQATSQVKTSPPSAQTAQPNTQSPTQHTQVSQQRTPPSTQHTQASQPNDAVQGTQSKQQSRSEASHTEPARAEATRPPDSTQQVEKTHVESGDNNSHATNSDNTTEASHIEPVQETKSNIKEPAAPITEAVGPSNPSTQVDSGTHLTTPIDSSVPTTPIGFETPSIDFEIPMD